MKIILLVILSFVSVLSFSVSAQESIAKQVQIENNVYIDVRSWVEHKVDSIDGDINIHVSEIVSGVEAQFPDKSTPIKLYCERGVRAETARQKLVSAGYLNVENVGGIDDARKRRFKADLIE